MAVEHELRVGICSCTELYHSQLEGNTVDIPDIPISFRIVESTVLEKTFKTQRESMRQARTHLFLDVHQQKDGYYTSLSLINLYPGPKGRGDQVWIADAINHVGGSLAKRWSATLEPPSIEEILDSIPQVLLTKGQENFERWLARMTPPGWSIPEQIKATPSSLCVID